MKRENKCEDCFYSAKSLNEDLVVCTYMDDVFNVDGGPSSSEKANETAKYFVELTNFSGDVYEAFADDGSDEPKLKMCVTKDSWCGKFAKRV
jgi:hypothetical protein